LKTFKEYLAESAKGNYVSINVASPLPDFKLEQMYGGSKVCEFGDQHVTLIYSTGSDVPLSRVDRFIELLPKTVQATVIGVEAFDAVPKDGERDENLCTIVLTLKSEQLDKIYEGLLCLGMKHSYPEFSPHISLMYGFERERKEECLEYLRSRISGLTVELAGYKNSIIVKDWADKLGKK
jgi:hypothetical protein